MNRIAAVNHHRLPDSIELSSNGLDQPLSLVFSIALKGSFNGEDAVASYLNNVRATKADNHEQGADDMSVHEEWISCSHWGMFPLERNPSN